MVTELSRLGRSTSQLSALADELSERKVSLKILNLGIDTGTPAGKLVYSIIAAVAEMERDLLIERTNSGLAASRARGRKGGRKREFCPRRVQESSGTVRPRRVVRDRDRSIGWSEPADALSLLEHRSGRPFKLGCIEAQLGPPSDLLAAGSIDGVNTREEPPGDD